MISGSTQPEKMICTTRRGGARTGALLAPQLKVLSEAGFVTPPTFPQLPKTFSNFTSGHPAGHLVQRQEEPMVP